MEAQGLALAEMTLDLHDAFEGVLRDYPSARAADPIGRQHALWQLLERTEQSLRSYENVRKHSSIEVAWSLGRGNWAAVPWISLLDTRETTSTKRGVYCVYLFRGDMSGLYLTLNQGVTEPREELGLVGAREFLQSRAEAVRSHVSGLSSAGFRLDNDIDLRVEGGLGSQYEGSTIAHKFYKSGQVPESAGLLSDLGVLLDTYVGYIDTQAADVALGPRSWIFQGNPNLYDIRGSIQSVEEMTWLVKQHRDRIRAGDRVYLWESGSAGGILATARVLTDPQDTVEEPDMAPFVRDPAKFVGSQPRVRLRIERRLPLPIPRHIIAAQPHLRDLTILKAPQGTNFPLSAEQSRLLDSLMGLDDDRSPTFRRAEATRRLYDAIRAHGYVFEPWQIAAYATALRTKPFVILAGVSGTGKSKLPALVATATGGEYRLIPVRPDWTDSSELLGYTDLRGTFRPGRLLDFARDAGGQSGTHFVCVLDEMNLARVEHYFAEALSAMEDRHRRSDGGYESAPLLGQRLSAEAAEFGAQNLPPNLAIVGTVNMDETTHGFSRKVIDRAFTLELSDVALGSWTTSAPVPLEVSRWPVPAWFPRAIRLAELTDLSSFERTEIDRVVGVVSELNGFLAEAQLQVGYRSRDEIGLFVLHAADTAEMFTTGAGRIVDPLDLALHMKVLPRIAGGSGAVRMLLLRLLGWASVGAALSREDQATDLVRNWDEEGRPGFVPEALYPRTLARICLMWQRLVAEGFTSYWL